MKTAYTLKQRRDLEELAEVTQRIAKDTRRRDGLIVKLHAQRVMPVDIAASAGVTRGRVHQVVQKSRRDIPAEQAEGTLTA